MLLCAKDIAMLSDMRRVLAIMHNDGQKLHKQTDDQHAQSTSVNHNNVMLVF